MELARYLINFICFVLVVAYALLMVLASAGYIRPRVQYWVVAVLCLLAAYDSWRVLLTFWHH